MCECVFFFKMQGLTAQKGAHSLYKYIFGLGTERPCLNRVTFWQGHIVLFHAVVLKQSVVIQEKSIYKQATCQVHSLHFT